MDQYRLVSSGQGKTILGKVRDQMAAFLRKDTVVRITEPGWNLIGETYKVTGKKRTRKGVVEMELESLEVANRVTYATPEQVTASHLLTPDQHADLTTKQIERKQHAEAMAKAFEEAQAKQAAEALAKLAADDKVWDGTVPVVTKDYQYETGTDRTVELGITGPAYTGRDGKEYTRDLEVTVYIRNGRWGLPKDYTEAQVNWSAIGSCSPANARAYARLILAAADKAEELAK